ncbi:MAG: UDP-3-O-(3-hydroxymyristoyl)glucosamine N-acyltransferase, partial [Myxococcota bacterium]
MQTVGSLAALVGGRVIGDASCAIVDLADLAHAGPEHVSFFANPRYQAALRASRAGAILLAQPQDDLRTTQIICANPYLAMAQVATALHPAPTFVAGIETGALVAPGAHVDPRATIRRGAVIERGARVGARSVIYPTSYVGIDAVVGDDCLIYPGVQVLERCALGSRVILHAGVVIGADGFGYAPDAAGRRHKIPQVGVVVLEDDVEIGANTTIDRATFGETRIGARTKVDNLVQIAHNVTLGEDCVVVSQSGIAGSTRVGNRVIMGAQGGILGHIHVADDVTLGARAGVAHSIDHPG